MKQSLQLLHKIWKMGLSWHHYPLEMIYGSSEQGQPERVTVGEDLAPSLGGRQKLSRTKFSNDHVKAENF